MLETVKKILMTMKEMAKATARSEVPVQVLIAQAKETAHAEVPTKGLVQHFPLEKTKTEKEKITANSKRARW